MMHGIVIFGLTLSAISFALFFVALLVHLFRTGPQKAGAEMTEQQGDGGLAQLFEGFAKLADSLNHSSPVVLSLMASIIFFALSLLAVTLDSTKHDDVPRKDDAKNTISMSTQQCVFGPFDPGTHELSKVIFDQLTLDADHCEKRLMDQVKSGAASILLLVGHSDRRHLRGHQVTDYGSNETLAYQRALEIKKALLNKYSPTTSQPLSSFDFSQRMVIVEGGPAYVDPMTKEPQLGQDRSVEVISLGLVTASSISPKAFQ